MVVPVPNPQHCFEQACEAFEIMNAAGGIVTNDHHQVLMIYRFGRWDLPKGKQEAGETLETTALREVQEETGVQNLSLCPEAMSTVQLTYHCYRYEGVLTLKKTWWYRMYTPGNEMLLPQTEEGIDKAEWVPYEELPIRLSTTYASIRDMMERVSIQ